MCSPPPPPSLFGRSFTPLPLSLLSPLSGGGDIGSKPAKSGSTNSIGPEH